MLILTACSGEDASEPDQQVVEDTEVPDAEIVEFTERNWVHLRSDLELNAVELVDTYPSVFGLGAGVELDIVDVIEDGDWEGVRVQQFHHGIPIEGAQFVIHVEGSRASEITGKGVVGFEQRETPDAGMLMDAARAVDIAISAAPATVYSWDLAHEAADAIELEQLYGQPSAQLVWAAREHTYSSDAQDYVLAYRVEVKTVEPNLDSRTVYVDAQSGDVLSNESSVKHNNCKNGTVSTLYYDGDRSFTTWRYPLVTPYLLTDACRGDGILTRCNQISICNYSDHDNHWSGAPATAHWAAQRAWEYFRTRHGRTGVDGAGQRLYVFPDTDFDGPNARWWTDGSMQVGGSGPDWGNMATLDVIGHEFTHGVVQHTSGLVAGEAGALNESFADIFGAMIEMDNAGVSANNWLCGEEAVTARSMSAPWELNNPSVYGGPHWYESSDPHSRAMVQSHWFYLLSQGGSQLGVKVNGISAYQAARIAYRNLTTLGPHADYADARTGSILAAGSLYGYCSPQVQETTNAWAAVGVGEKHDLCLKGNSTPCHGDDEVYSILTSAPSWAISWTIPEWWDYTMSPDKKSVTVHDINFDGIIGVSYTENGFEHKRVIHVSVDYDCDGGGCLLDCFQ